MNNKPPRPRKCKCGCGETFTPFRSMQVAATPECAQRMAEKKREKAERAAAKIARQENRKAREKLKTLRDWMRDAQEAVNAYVRARDDGLPCISCDRHHQGQWHAGHYLSRGAHPELALEPLNIHKQCQPCNTHLSGNQVKYRAGLIRRLGIEVVEWLEGPHSPNKYTADDLKAIRDDYRARLRHLKKNL